MVIDHIFIPLTFLVLCIAAYIDIRTREVPDWLSYAFIMAAIGVRAIFSVEQGIMILLSGILGLLICFTIACLLYYTSQWGGGDSKLLMGMGAAIGVTIPLQASSLHLLWFFIGLLFLGAIYGLIWMSIIATQNRKVFREQWTLTITHSHKSNFIVLGITAALILLAIAHPLFWPIVPFPMIVLYLFLFVNTVERSCFYIYKLPKNLVEGDWLAENVTISGKTVLSPKTLEKEDIMMLKSFEVEKKVKKVLIKEGIPFTPGFVLAYAALLAGPWWIERVAGFIF